MSCPLICIIFEQGGPSVAELQRLWQMLLELAVAPQRDPSQDTPDWSQLDAWALLPTTEGVSLLEMIRLQLQLTSLCYVNHFGNFPDHDM